MGFRRIEDGAFGPAAGDDFHFVTTGSGGGNRLGRAYRIEFDPADPLAATQLHVAINADQVDAAGGDTALSPDNVDVSADWLAVNEDGTDGSRPEMEERNRDGSIWLFDPQAGYAGDRVAELVGRSRGGRDGIKTGAGIWETSGIIDTAAELGAGSWLFDVQAHPPTAAPEANTVEDGQLLLMKPAG
jgi:hypothetical protein